MKRVVVAVACLLLPACQEPATGGSAPPPSTSDVPAIETASASPTTTTTTSADVRTPTASCPPWAPSPRTVTTYSVAGRGDFFRELRYDFEKGVVSVHDSDPFAEDPSKEAKDPRVLKKDKKLEGDERKKLEAALVAICPDEAAFEGACAPGGCSRLTVTRGDGTETKIENNDWVGKVSDLLAPFFPALRRG